MPRRSVTRRKFLESATLSVAGAAIIPPRPTERTPRCVRCRDAPYPSQIDPATSNHPMRGIQPKSTARHPKTKARIASCIGFTGQPRKMKRVLSTLPYSTTYAPPCRDHGVLVFLKILRLRHPTSGSGSTNCSTRRDGRGASGSAASAAPAAAASASAARTSTRCPGRPTGGTLRSSAPVRRRRSWGLSGPGGIRSRRIRSGSSISTPPVRTCWPTARSC